MVMSRDSSKGCGQEEGDITWIEIRGVVRSRGGNMSGGRGVVRRRGIKQ